MIIRPLYRCARRFSLPCVFLRLTANGYPRLSYHWAKWVAATGLSSFTSVGISKHSRQVLCFSICERFFADRCLQGTSLVLREFLPVLNVIILLIYDGNGQWFWGHIIWIDRRWKIFSNHPRNYDRWRIYVSHNKIWITYYIIDVNVIIYCLTGSSLPTVNHLTRIFWTEKQQERNYWCK